MYICKRFFCFKEKQNKKIDLFKINVKKGKKKGAQYFYIGSP